jgi:hypothetical protein
MPSGLFGGALFGTPGVSPPPPPPPGEGSVLERLLHSVADVVTGIGLDPTPLVKVRKRPAVLQQDDCTAAQPVIVVCGKLAKTELVWAGTVLRTYSVGVYVASPTPGELAVTAPTHRWLEELNAAIHDDGEFANVPEMNETRPSDRVPFDPPTLDKMFNWNVLGFEIECLESRDTPSTDPP